jgi:hypothetical protein
MSHQDTPSDTNFPTVEEMQRWLEREVTDIRRAADLRILDATSFVRAFVSGEIGAEEAERRSYVYSERWGDILPGVFRTQGLTDEAIVAALDTERKKPFAGRLSERPLANRGKSGSP